MDDFGGILGNEDFLESNTFQLDELVNELLKDDELETVKANDSSSDDGYNGSISPPNSSPSQVKMKSPENSQEISSKNSSKNAPKILGNPPKSKTSGIIWKPESCQHSRSSGKSISHSDMQFG